MKRLTIRARLTFVYGGLLLLAGMVLLGVTYVLVEQRMSTAFGVKVSELRSQVPDVQVNQFLTADDAERLRVYARQVQDEARQNALESLLTQGGIALAVVSVTAVAFSWLIAGRALQPLHQITGTARRIAGAGGVGYGLHERIALQGPRDEVKELADTFDLMLERLDRSFDGQRRFVANASHELRTPLALNRSLLELAITRPDAPAELRQLGETLLAINERHERLIDGLLTLADSEQRVVDRTRIDLAEVAAYVADQAAGTSNLPIHRRLAPAPTAGDPVLLERLTQNLVENAVRHNLPSGGEVWIDTDTVDGWARLTVINTGPVVPGYEVETLFQPFRRLRRDRVAGERGFGLGLSIVRAVATAHGGAVRAEPREGGGLAVTVELPAVAARPDSASAVAARPGSGPGVTGRPETGPAVPRSSPGATVGVG
ncbi:cell wall metabolism sensor histidine kinase WalK [Micromonospora sp. HM5-17]|jgi:signal transduction histidine kinase|uniref:sensor histidine kinase n=1 Tax=Micromonospora sp. HM5-17 TaxID=2487710 RepID=UPI000F484C80|nr:HAMP domain-containing sensor histidine kinase [Micromonospora sp. HM5-17]ROT27971.1 sensor histidine kinase [Micromonospora sp. HM5-17]